MNLPRSYRIVWIREKSLSGVGVSFVGPKMAMSVAMTPKAVSDLDLPTANLDLYKSLLKTQDIVCIRSLNLESPDSQTHCFSQLQIALPADSKITALLSQDENFKALPKSFTLFTGKPIFLKSSESSKDLRSAAKVFDFESQVRLELLQIEAPLIPWGLDDTQSHVDFISKHGAAPHYDQTVDAVSRAQHDFTRKKKMLLHVCCGPDAAGVVQQLKNEFELTCFWYDPNIQPREEHDKRLDAFLKVAELEKIPVIVGEYDVENFYDSIQGLEHTPETGAKCSNCYDLRLERAAREASDRSFDIYSTTLAISPHKVQEKLKRFGELNYKKFQVPYLARNFTKQDGFKDSVEYTTLNDIYRQDYCGCYFSLPEGGPQAKAMAQDLGITQNFTKGENPFRKKDLEHPYLGELSPSQISEFRTQASKDRRLS